MLLSLFRKLGVEVVLFRSTQAAVGVAKVVAVIAGVGVAVVV